MTPAEYDEQERREVVRRFEQEEARADVELAKAQANLEQAQAHKREIESKRLRAETAANDPSFGTEFCSDCFVETSERVPMTPQAAGYGEDVYHCRNGHQRRVRIR